MDLHMDLYRGLADTNVERNLPLPFTQLAGAVEYTDCISAEE